MRIDILTLFPDMLQAVLAESMLGRAQKMGKLQLGLHNIRDFSTNKHKKVDDAPYGGTAGMVMSVQPLADCIKHLQAQHSYDEIIYLTPDGQTLSQGLCNALSLKGNLMLICGHYKGIDQRIRDKYITLEISIGDYVLTGGELAAAVLTDAVVRLIPGVLGDETSALSDSFQDNLLAPPVYTRPAEFEGMPVPEILRSGDDKKIKTWLQEQALEKTRRLRPDLLD
jgi:tRNA (guanine37-N1)-methyltransferase